jgi:UDP-3-O-[3-hydroxymyristoyl] glucosamine N-acyltransferase
MKKFFTALTIAASLALATSAFAQAPAKKATAEKIAVTAEMAVITTNAKKLIAHVGLPKQVQIGDSCKIKAGAKITLLGEGDKPGTFKFRNESLGATGYCPFHIEFTLASDQVEKLRTASAGAPAKN